QHMSNPRSPRRRERLVTGGPVCVADKAGSRANPIQTQDLFLTITQGLSKKVLVVQFCHVLAPSGSPVSLGLWVIFRAAHGKFCLVTLLSLFNEGFREVPGSPNQRAERMI
ncbi:hypothetical protein, partial [Hyphomicrobium sulfonivorans]|uniref:hypothetical protein n=1 Tax=Hyphomicrobium sulfonivorans TaxID=121290 RepID=UPI001AEF1C9B